MITLFEVRDACPVPPLATGSVPVTPVVNGSPVALVRVADEGVPKAPPVKYNDPAPVSSEITPANSAEVVDDSADILSEVVTKVFDEGIAVPLIELAVADPISGATKNGEVFITKTEPDPVCEATDVALPTEVIGPVRLAFVVTVEALPEIDPVINSEKVFDPAMD